MPHLWLAAHYQRRDPREYIGEFPLDKVVEIHVGGVEDDRDLGGPWVAPTLPTREILELGVWIAERAPGTAGRDRRPVLSRAHGGGHVRVGGDDARSVWGEQQRRGKLRKGH